MEPRSVKYIISAVIVVLILSVTPIIGLTDSVSDERQGVMIDFGYWDASWTDMVFSEGTTAVEALVRASAARGYESPVFLTDGTVYSVNGQTNLPNAVWNPYLLRGSVWERCTAIDTADVSDERIVCWARASDVGNVIPGTDASGHTYYDYAADGKSLVTGKDLRVISLAPSITEMIVSVGGLDCLIGTDSYSNYPESLAERRGNGDIRTVGGYIDPNYERILSMSPDLVFCDGSAGEHTSMANRLRKSGIDCVVLYGGKDMATLYDNIWIVASALGRSSEANTVISEIRTVINDVAGIAGTTGRRAFVSLSADPSPWTAGSDTFMSDVLFTAGGKNVFDSQASSWFMVSKEQIYIKQPDVIIIIYESRTVSSVSEYERIVDGLDPLWKDTPAYANGDIYLFSGTSADVLSRPGPRLSEAVELIAKIFNPDGFTERDSQDLIPKFFGDDYKRYLRYQGAVS